MKKSKIWIHVCVCLLLFISLEAHSLDAGNVKPGIDVVKIVRQNIPIDYKIHIMYIPKTEAGMCWVTLNLFYLEDSLSLLSDKFGDKASNKIDIQILIDILQLLRRNISHDSLNEVLWLYQCHYQNDSWHRERYFDFVDEFLKATLKDESIDDCYEPPACPSTQHPGTNRPTTAPLSPSPPGPTTVPLSHSPTPTCKSDCSSSGADRQMSEIVERSLFSLLFIPLIALIVLLIWRVRSQKNSDVERNPGEEGLFTGAEGTAPPPNGDVSERNNLNGCETV